MIDFNFDQARFNMVEQQIRTWDVLDAAVLDLLRNTPREKFVPAKYKNLAYSDIAIPLAHGESMMHPKYEARLLQALKITSDDEVLEIGTGTGYVTALLAQQAKHVYSVDIYPDFIRGAMHHLRAIRVQGVTLEEGDASKGWKDHSPYDAIAVTGSVPEIPKELKESLKVGGRMFIVVGESPAMTAYLITRTAQNEWKEQSLFETELKPLINATKPPRFIF